MPTCQMLTMGLSTQHRQVLRRGVLEVSSQVGEHDRHQGGGGIEGVNVAMSKLGGVGRIKHYAPTV